jgi:hypothetical protein
MSFGANIPNDFVREKPFGNKLFKPYHGVCF